MAKVTSKERFFDFGVRGKFGKGTEYGERIYGGVFYFMSGGRLAGSSDPAPRRMTGRTHNFNAEDRIRTCKALWPRVPKTRVYSSSTTSAPFYAFYPIMT